MHCLTRFQGPKVSTHFSLDELCRQIGPVGSSHGISLESLAVCAPSCTQLSIPSSGMTRKNELLSWYDSISWLCLTTPSQLRIRPTTSVRPKHGSPSYGGSMMAFSDSFNITSGDSSDEDGETVIVDSGTYSKTGSKTRFTSRELYSCSYIVTS